LFDCLVVLIYIDSLGLNFGNAPSLLASQSKFMSSGSTIFLPNFNQINEDMNGVPPVLTRYSEEIKQVNSLSLLIPELYVNGDIAKLVRDTAPQTLY